MIKYVEGDILLSKAGAVAHGIAANDDFHSGLALKLRERWPAMYKDFRHFCKTSNPEAGTLWTWGGADGTRIVNLLTQDGVVSHHGSKPGRATLPNVAHCLKALRQEIERQKFKSVALPRLATGVGGLEWKDVEPLIQEYLGNLAVPVFVYKTYKQGQQAVEA